MEIKIQSIKFDATEKLEAYIQKKVAKLEKISEDIIAVDVYLKVTKPEAAQNKEVEIKIQVPGTEIFASKTSDTFEESTDLVVDALDKQLAKYKEKQRAK
ncbi:MAG: ribosome-associated translation inhibitor RaiA [Prevotellaceae bacterium]|jgi:putative sigma-54 modulation protein|nr:ribosome-associated translation inhibitor RaiA [Prevotellaceae bacterium]